MNSTTISSPVGLTSRLLTQNVEFEIDTSPDFGCHGDLPAAASMRVNVTNHNLPMSTWKFETTMYPRGEMKISSHLLEVVNDSEVKVILSGVLLDMNGAESFIGDSTGAVIQKRGKLNLVIDRHGITWQHFVRNNTTMHRGMVTVRLKMIIEYLDPTIQNKEVATTKFMETSLQAFSVVMKDLLTVPGFTNAKIVCGDDMEIAVNKEILASRSPVFEAMFRTDMQEAATGVVHVEEICGRSMKVLVEYLTTGKLDESWREDDVVIHLAMAVDKYGIQSLRDFLDDWLGEESLVRSNMDLLNMVADCGYTKAEVKIAENVGKRARTAKTRDEFMAAIGLTTGPSDNQTKERTEVEMQLMIWMDKKINQQLTTESSLELVNLAADLGLAAAETRLVEELGMKLETSRSRDELLTVLGLGPKYTSSF